MLVKDKVYFRNRIPIPETKNDHYLFFMINGGVFENLPKPHTKLEHYLYNLCWNKVYGRKVYADAILNSNLELSNMGTTIFDLGENRVENGVKIKYRFMLKEGGNDTPATIFFKLFADNNSEQDDINFDSGYMARFSQLVETPVIGQLYEYEYTFPQNSNNFLLKDCRFLKPCIEIVKTEGGFGKTHAIEVQEISITLGDKIYYVTSTFKDYQGLESSIVKIIEPSDGELASEGSKWLSGEGVPNIIEGTVGDFYLHIPTGDVYTKQEDNTWVNTGLSIKGIRGEQGIQGIQGIQGVKGEKGDAFAVAKTFESIEAMNSGFANDGVKEGQFVIITSNVEDEDNAKLYVKGAKSYAFVSDLSGATGIKGDQGIQGIQGVPGKNGAKWWHGTGALTDNTIGADGDYYLDRTTGDVHTKTKGVWGKANVNIKGKDGSTIIEGSLEKPVDTSGNEGDFYLNTTNGDLWKKKNNVWEKIANFKGEKGDKGLDGNKIINGTVDTPDNSAGNEGDFYLNTKTGDLWKKEKGVYTKLANIKGDKGDTGLTGVKGDTGVGIQDITVAESQVDGGNNVVTITMTDGNKKTFNIKNGTKGSQGVAGASGSAGATTQGVKGDKGDTWRPTVDATTGKLTWTLESSPTSNNPPQEAIIKGAKGDNGSTWIVGDKDPTGTVTGKEGDLYLDNKTWNVYKYSTNAWSNIGNIKGEQGEKGADGTSVATGGGTVQTVKGEKGEPGVAGKDGSEWFNGIGVPSDTTNTEKLKTSVEGDYYLQDNGDVWKRNATTWEKTGISLKGATGEAGQDGKDGASGGATVGQSGQDGKDGSVWLSGAGNPTAENTSGSKVGDYYLNTTDGSIHKKTQDPSTWQQLMVIKGINGSQGVAGTPGSKWHNGNGKPESAGLTSVQTGDYYIDNASGNYYVKDANNWRQLGTLKGKDGTNAVSTGGGQATPVKGEKGDQGVPGTPGEDGATWHVGNLDPTQGAFAEGKVGDLYLNSTTGDFYKKTGANANQWQRQGSLKGATGEAGVAGQQGVPGKDGAKGDQGTPGKDGKNGSTWYTGEAQPTADTPTGAVSGDYYLQKDGTVWKKGDNNQWTNTGISLKGATGEKGEAGQNGTAGVAQQGQAGADGKDGQTYKPEIKGNQITWTPTTETSPVNFVIPQEIVMSTEQPENQVKNNVWIDISGK